jgi:hypothetical protein
MVLCLQALRVAVAAVPPHQARMALTQWGAMAVQASNPLSLGPPYITQAAVEALL